MLKMFTPLLLDGRGRAQHRYARQRRLVAMESWAGVLKPGTKVIPLTKGKFTVVDEGDYEMLNQWNWHYHGHDGHDYAARDGDNTTEWMHRVINNTPDDRHTDHINGNGLDNRRCNLRTCSHEENHRSRRIQKHSSPFKGVSFRGDLRNQWCARIRVANKLIVLGYFAEPEDGARAYDEAAVKYFGEFAKTNKQCGLLEM